MATQTSILNDVGTLLRIPTKITNEITDKSCLCIGSIISDAKNRGETQTIINIGIGTLSIDLIDMQCKFVPGKNLKAAIKQSLDTTRDPLELMLEQTLADKLLAICEEVI